MISNSNDIKSHENLTANEAQDFGTFGEGLIQHNNIQQTLVVKEGVKLTINKQNLVDFFNNGGNLMLESVSSITLIGKDGLPHDIAPEALDAVLDSLAN